MIIENKNNEEKPYNTLEELLRDYGYSITEITQAREQLDFVKSVLALKEELEENFFKFAETGRVYSIQAPWGMGKTSYMNILIEQVSKSSNISPQFLCCYYYDSLYYGDVSEAIKTILQQLFKRIEEKYAIHLRGVRNIARNLTPGIEVSALFAKINFIQSTRDTNSIITEKIKNELKSIKGKIFVVIDDIDRLTSSEALHLLRLIRLLRSLPNTYIFLPVDYVALIMMLNKEKIANPGGYVRKIITEPIRLPSSFNDPRIFFQKNCMAMLNCEDNSETRQNIKDFWMGYLWELGKVYMNKLQRRRDDPLRFQIDTPASDAKWERAEDLLDSNDENFILDFFNKTRRSYNDSIENDYFVKFVVENSNPELFRFYRYGFIAPQTTFTRFMDGNYNERYMITQVGGGLAMTSGRNLFELDVYKESDILSITGRDKTSGDSDFYEADKNMSDQLESKKISFWDLLLEKIPDDNMPTVIIKHVSPRMIKRLMGEIERSELYQEARKRVGISRSNRDYLYALLKQVIRQFVDDYATD